MSLFDVLRYPISKIPSQDELAALPKSLYDEWKKAVSWAYDADFHCVSDYYDRRYYMTDIHLDIALLRKMIKDYDEPI